MVFLEGVSGGGIQYTAYSRFLFHNLNLSEAYTAQFTRIRLVHNRLLSRAFRSGVNHSRPCPRHVGEEIRNFFFLS